MARKIETKDFKFSSFDFDDQRGKFRAHASIFDIVDAYKDTVQRGAFKKTIREKKKFPLCWSHDIKEPIGLGIPEEDQKGLALDGDLNQDVRRGQELRALIKQGVPMGLSIGFETVKDDLDKETGVRTLKEISLWEISLCLFPACPGTGVQGIKSVDIFELAFGPEIEPPEEKPYPNEHSARLQDPNKFDKFRRTAGGKLYNKIDVPTSISIIWGHLRDGEPNDWAAQALRFPTKNWTAAEARKWLADNEVKYMDFEPAKEPEKSTPGTPEGKPAGGHLSEAQLSYFGVLLKAQLEELRQKFNKEQR